MVIGAYYESSESVFEMFRGAGSSQERGDVAPRARSTAFRSLCGGAQGASFGDVARGLAV